jgi:signal transduction histidine kinase
MQGTALDNYTLHGKQKDGHRFWIRIDCSYDKDVHGNVLGREGTVRDVTREVELGHTVDALQEKLQELTQDVDVLVHRYVSPTQRIEMGLQAQQEMLEFTRRGARDSARTGTLTSVWAQRLEDALVGALREMDSKEGSSLSSALGRIRNELTQRKFRGRQVLEDIETREAALATLGAVSGARRIQADLPATRDLRRIAVSVIDDALIRNSLRLLAQADELYSAIESMRSHLSRADSVFDFVPMDLVAMIDSILDLYASYASEKGLSFFYEGPVSLTVVAAEGHMRRAISNLVLNAIKYSYRRPDGYINVRVKEEVTRVSVSIENYGVPITRDELKTRNILKYGVRGEYSKDHNRMGSGVGLADVAYTIEQHRGGIRIQSSPSRKGADPEDYSLPFVTSVEIWVPGQREE